MSLQSSLTNPFVSPAQVWTRLAADLQRRAIRLMAQLAFNFVAAQCDSPIKESHDAVSTRHPQDTL